VLEKRLEQSGRRVADLQERVMTTSRRFEAHIAYLAAEMAAIRVSSGAAEQLPWQVALDVEKF
jgi:hypothetical protein